MNKTEKTFSLISVKDSFFKARYEVLDESTGDNHVITYENKAPVHPSLSEALQRMVYHVCLLYTSTFGSQASQDIRTRIVCQSDKRLCVFDPFLHQ